MKEVLLYDIKTFNLIIKSAKNKSLTNSNFWMTEHIIIENSGKASIAVWGSDMVINEKSRKDTGGE